MPLAANSRLGPYEIKATLGVGGMGEVYRARDSRLNRDVALKVLRADVAASPDLKSRFEREARAVAALNHPNIISVFDFGTDKAAGNVHYIVSELVDGESLRQTIAGKPVPIRKLIDIAVQIADGLAAAHSAGVVHRDLKPENIMLAKDNRVKILDFGLARQNGVTTPAGRGSDDTVARNSHSSAHLTSAGAILGTASYMSPEQAVGKEVTFRSDQFSLGLILHEMASGKQAFAHGSSVETMAAIVRDEPPPLEEKLPAPLRWIIDRCLRKEPEQRYDSTRDLYQELRSLRDHFSEAFSSSGTLAAVPVKARAARWRLPVALSLAGLFAGALIAYVLKPSGQDLARFHYTPFATEAISPVWSPDGKAVAYSSGVNGRYQVFLRYLNTPVAIQLTHEEFQSMPLGWASDRTHVVIAQFTYGAPLKLVSVANFGGDPERIMDISSIGLSELALSADGKALAALLTSEDHSVHVWISDPLGSPLRKYLPEPFTSHNLFGWPQLSFSPSGKKLLLSRSGDLDHPEVWLLPYPMGSGQPRQILEKLWPSKTPHFSWMADNRYAVIAFEQYPEPEQLWMIDTESGYRVPLARDPLENLDPTLSPDQNRLIFAKHSERFDIASVSIKDGATTKLVMAGHAEHKPMWAAHVPKLIWASERSGMSEIWLRSVDGTDRPVITVQDFPPGTTVAFENPSLSPEGDRVIYGRLDREGVTQIWVSSLNGGAPARLTNNPRAAIEFSGTWSPDGRQYAYLQQLNGETDLMTVRTNGDAAPTMVKRHVSVSFLPDWSPDGQWITYADANGQALISPDGKTVKPLGRLNSDYLVFSKNGKLLYGITGDPDHPTLFSFNPVTLKKTVIKELGKEWSPQDNLYPAIRYSMAPDGTSFVYAVSEVQNDLWMLEGFRQPRWTDRLQALFSH